MKCYICQKEAEFKCDICNKYICDFHSRDYHSTKQTICKDCEYQCFDVWKEEEQIDE